MSQAEDYIGFYEGELACLSNFSSFVVDWRGRRWPTAEHAYQAAKFLDHRPDIVAEIAAAPSAYAARQLAQQYKTDIAPGFPTQKVVVMEDICRHKLQQHLYIQQQLRATGDMVLIKDLALDDFWGWGPDHAGANQLGKIWMRLRDELQ